MNPEASQGVSGMASGGLNFTPYEVPNVAVIPASNNPNELSSRKQVSFNNGQQRGNQGALPEKLPSSLSAGGYARESRTDQRTNHSPLRQSPRRDEQVQQSLYAQP